MDFLHELILYLSQQKDSEGVYIIPPEVTDADVDREKTYLVDLPATPDNVYVFNAYDIQLPSLTPKSVGVIRIQLQVRNIKQAVAISNIYRVWNFLINRADFIEDISSTRWVIFDVKQGPGKLGVDEKGNHIWTFSFPVTTQLY